MTLAGAQITLRGRLIVRKPIPKLRGSGLLKVADQKRNYSLFFHYQKRYSKNGEAARSSPHNSPGPAPDHNHR
jgi:hypothetical protein